MRISLPALSSFEDERGEFAEPSLSAIVNGDALELKGRTKPFHASLETIVALNFADVDIPSYLAYSPVPLPVRIDKGTLSTALDLVFIRAKDNTLSATVKGTLRLDDVAMRDAEAPDGGPVAVLRGVDVKIAEVAWPQNALRLDAVTIDGPQVWVRREKNGSINWQNMLARIAPVATPPVAKEQGKPPAETKGVPPAEAKGGPPAEAKGGPQVEAKSAPPPFRFAIGEARIAEGLVLFEDLAAPSGKFRVVTQPIAVRATNLSNAENADAAIEASFATDGDEHVTHAGTLRLSPFAASGEVSVKRIRLARYQPYFGDVLAADLDGLADVDARYALGADGNMKVGELRVGGTGLHVRDKARGEVVRIGTLAVSGGEMDLNQRTVGFSAIALRQCRAALVRDQAGRLNVASLVKTAAPSAPSSAAPPAAPGASRAAAGARTVPGAATLPAGAAAPATASAPPPKDWTIAVRQASLERCAVQFDDLAAAQGAAARVVLDPLDLRVENWSTRAENRARIDVRTKVNGGGQIAVKGIAGMTPVVADLDLNVDALDIVPLQPYAADRLNVRVTSGAVSTRGKLALSGSPLAVRYRGDATLARLASTTKADGEDFLNWGSLQAKGIDVAVNPPGAAPLAVTLDELALADFYSRLIVNADGTLNVQYVVRDPAADAAKSAAASVGITTPGGAAAMAAPPAPAGGAQPAGAGGPQPASAAAAATASAPPPPVTINRITLASGRVNFSDRFIKPNYSANINDVSGSVTGLSSDFASRANVDIKGRYDPSAPVEIKGTINPLRGNLYLDIAASCKDVELAQFTPYAQKYAGYGITKGKLSLSVKYQIDDRKLTADNTLLLDQLTFGEKVESPDATKLPVLFAVSLLKNAKGEIDLNLPISGSLDDPQFSVFGIVLKIIGNLLAKAATAPFALIGALVGGGSGEDLAYVEFPAGESSAFAAGQEDKLAKIAKALGERPGLSLDIQGRSDPVADADALHRRALMRKLAAQRPDESLAKGEAGAPAQALAIPLAEYPALLKRAYDNEKFDKPRNALGIARELPPAEMEKLLLANIKVTPDEVRALSEQRANAAKSALIKLGVAGERMYIVTNAESAEAKRAPRVEFALK